LWTVAAVLLSCTGPGNSPEATGTQVEQLTSANVAYVFDFGNGFNDTTTPADKCTGSGIFFNGSFTSTFPGGTIPVSGGVGTYKGVHFTNVPIATINASPSTALNGFDTVVMYEVCTIGDPANSAALGAINAFLEAGNKVLIFDGDACSNGTGGIKAPDYSHFLFPFGSDNPGPKGGTSGSYSKVEASTLTTGISVGDSCVQNPQCDALGDANVFDSAIARIAGGWCTALQTTNTDNVTGNVEAYARTTNGGLVVWSGEDFWCTFSVINHTQNDHLQQIFDLMLAQTFNPDTPPLPCTNPPSGIKLDPPTQTRTIGTTATVTASLFDENSNPLPNQAGTFTIQSGPNAGTTHPFTSDGSGHAVFTYPDNAGVPGTDAIGASFTDGLGTHNSNVVNVIWIAAVTTLVYTGDTTQDFDDPATLAATLTTPQGPVVGQPVTFALGGQTCTGKTDGSGKASCTLTPNVAAGVYTVTASFAGTPALMPSSATATFTVTLEETTLSYTGDTLIANGGTAHLSGLLLEDGTTPIAGRTVTFTLGSGASAQTCTGVTLASGVASCDINPVAQPLGPGVVSASFAGDAFYKPASASAATLLYAVLAHGSFVIGDGNSAIGDQVEFWGAQWWKDNVVSVTGTPPAFKGFVDQGSPVCGATWTTDPGNSSDPPATVPSFMAVIVSDSITQSGSQISGDTPKVVVVKTDPGYAGDPGHAGTGSVVATVCGHTGS
jgi:hypothetical protein